MGQADTGFNYAEALQKSLFFYECQRSGRQPDNNRVTWRGDSGLTDGRDNGVDLTGGWYDAGDHVKFNFPMAGAATMLAWGGLECRRGYERCGQWPFLLDNLRWVCDYFVRCHTAPDELWGQVGLGHPDHAWWGPCEVMSMPRPSFKIDAAHPGTDLACETAAALASSSMLFKDSDPAYAATLLDHAVLLFDFGDRCRGKYSDSIKDAHNFYRSSDYLDELVWGAIWLYKATGKTGYLLKATAYYDDLPLEKDSPHRRYKFTHNWQDKDFGAAVLLALATTDSKYREDTERWLDWLTIGYEGDRVHYTPGGLAWIGKWGSLRLVANTAFIAFVYADSLPKGERKTRYHAFGIRQINYALGENPYKRSFLVGYGHNPPRNPHHRTAHSSWTNDIHAPAENRHVLYGALTGGPDKDDHYVDDRGDYVLNEVACDYNAGFTSALARLVQEFGGEPVHDFPPTEHASREFSIEAVVEESGPGDLDLRLTVTNRTAWPPRATDSLAVRYFLSGDHASESFMIEANGAHWAGIVTPSSAETGTGRRHILIDLAGDLLFPGDAGRGSREIRLLVSGPAAWDPSTDWVLAGVPAPDGALIANVALYSAGVLVAGHEPS